MRLAAFKERAIGTLLRWASPHAPGGHRPQAWSPLDPAGDVDEIEQTAMVFNKCDKENYTTLKNSDSMRLLAGSRNDRLWNVVCLWTQ